MIDKLITFFNNVWPYQDSMCEPFVVEDAGNAYRIIVKNTCEWYKRCGGCSMCNYSHRSGVTATEILTKRQNEIICSIRLLNKNYENVKFYINGSFFNNNELSFDVAVSFLSELKLKFGITQVCVETRSQFLNRDLLRKYIDQTQLSFEICFGIESTSDEIRHFSVHKGMNFSSFVAVYHDIKDLCTVTAYLLVKPPFLSELEAIEDVVSSVNELVDLGITNISYTPVAVQKNTLLEFLFQEGLYRPVWIWSLIEINSRLSGIHKKFPSVKLGGLDYYPEPLQTAFNCEECTEYIFNLLRTNNNLTWSDIPKGKLCNNCYVNWKKEISQVISTSIIDRIEVANKMLCSVVERSKCICAYFESNKKTVLTDVAKTIPSYRTKLNNVGVENVKIPFSIIGFPDTVAICDASISLDEFHRGIHMSRLIESINSLADTSHSNILLDMEYIMNTFTADVQMSLSFSLIKEIHNHLSKKINYVNLDIFCKMSKKQLPCDNNTDGIERSVSITIPFINACPCTKTTVDELFDSCYTHTQKGTIEVTLIDCDVCFSHFVDFMIRFVTIYDLLKREDEIEIVKKAVDDALFCEDVCRQVSSMVLDEYRSEYGHAIVKVTTDESIHPHQAFAEKEFNLKTY